MLCICNNNAEAEERSLEDLSWSSGRTDGVNRG